MTKLCIYLSVAVVMSVAVWSVDGQICRRCPLYPCEPPTDCEYGVGRWGCMCCDDCLQGPDERCGGFLNVHGICGEGLECELTHPDHSDGVCVSSITNTTTTSTDAPGKK